MKKKSLIGIDPEVGQQGHSFKIACCKLLECLNVIGAILLLLLVTINNNWIFFSKYDQITIHLLRKKVKMVGRILQTAKVRHYCATVKKNCHGRKSWKKKERTYLFSSSYESDVRNECRRRCLDQRQYAQT